MSVLQTRVGIEQEVAEGSLIFVPLRDPKISPSRLMLLSRSPTDMSAAATAFGTLQARGLDDLQH
ncbi:hypothetical protein LJR255_004710 [Pararhizobium sp. LjRoot255]|uniref:hypothetical protein n=1 Tax=Pararhizobium sp. LjRoot255 TaxID=3342298 RepID=UPI003ECC3C8A